MKTKLLKKIRTEYTITHYPNGIRFGEMFYTNNIFYLESYTDEFLHKACELNPKPNTLFCTLKAYTKQDCINLLLEELITDVRGKYPKLGSKSTKRLKTNKVWYNEKT